jgi:transcriptional regulator of NAD metabolism
MEKFAKNYPIPSLKYIISKYNNHTDKIQHYELTGVKNSINISGTKKELVKRIYTIKDELVTLGILSSSLL